MGHSLWPESFQASRVELPLEKIWSICCKLNTYNKKSETNFRYVISFFFSIPFKRSLEASGQALYMQCCELTKGLRVSGLKLDYTFPSKWHSAHHMILLYKHLLGKSSLPILQMRKLGPYTVQWLNISHTVILYQTIPELQSTILYLVSWLSIDFNISKCVGVGLEVNE